MKHFLLICQNKASHFMDCVVFVVCADTEQDARDYIKDTRSTQYLIDAHELPVLDKVGIVFEEAFIE